MLKQEYQNIYDAITAPGLTEEEYCRIVNENRTEMISEFTRLIRANESKQRSANSYLNNLLVASFFVSSRKTDARLDSATNAIESITEECRIMSEVTEKLKAVEDVSAEDLSKALNALINPTKLSF